MLRRNGPVKISKHGKQVALANLYVSANWGVTERATLLVATCTKSLPNDLVLEALAHAENLFRSLFSCSFSRSVSHMVSLQTGTAYGSIECGAKIN